VPLARGDDPPDPPVPGFARRTGVAGGRGFDCACGCGWRVWLSLRVWGWLRVWGGWGVWV